MLTMEPANRVHATRRSLDSIFVRGANCRCDPVGRRMLPVRGWAGHITAFPPDGRGKIAELLREARGNRMDAADGRN